MRCTANALDAQGCLVSMRVSQGGKACECSSCHAVSLSSLLMHCNEWRHHHHHNTLQAILHGNKHGRASEHQPVPSGRTATGGGFQCRLPAAACEARISSRVDSTHATAGIVKELQAS